MADIDADTPAVEFETFTRDDAWHLGVALVERCRSESLPVAVGIWLGEQRVFAAGLSGSTATNDSWVIRKANIVRHFERPSVDVYRAYASSMPDFYERFGLDRAEYAASEGALPITVSGCLVGVLSISGLDSGGDHDLAASALAAYRRCPVG